MQGSVTHTSRSDKTMLTVTWTAPPLGTGTIYFGYIIIVIIIIIPI